MFKSMRAIILLFVAGLVITTTVGITYFAQRELSSSAYKSQYDAAQALIDSTLLNVSNEYQSLLFSEKAALDRRKKELKAVVGIAYGAVLLNYTKYKEGKLTEKEAKSLSIEQLKNMRYDDGVGYIWVNDTKTPFPSMIMHATLPELDGTILDNPRFDCALGIKKNLFSAFRDICEKSGSGYVDYFWPKPTPEGLSKDQPKLSYVQLFKEWNWIIGSGLYVDDLEEDVRKRFDAILHELRTSFAQIKIGKSGYVFIFTGTQELLVHPTYANTTTSTLRNPQTGRLIGEELIESANKTGVHEYLWDKPPNNVGNFKFKKRTYVKYFEPLDWYICSSIYVDELEQPGRILRNKTIIFSLGILALALALATILSRKIAHPLLKLTEASQAIGKGGLSATQIPVSGPTETRHLGYVIKQMLESIRNGMEELSMTNIQLEKEVNDHAIAKEELLKLRNHLKNIIDSMPSILVGIDNIGRINLWNTSATKSTGLTSDQACGQMLQLLFPELTNEIDRAITVIKTGKTAEIARAPRKIDGQTHYENITVYPLTNDGQEGAVIRIDDITDSVRIEEMMIQTEKMMSIGGLAAGMAHEINNPLGGILQGAQNIERRLSPELKKNIEVADKYNTSLESIHDYMQERKIFTMLRGIRDAAERSAQIIANMLNFSRKTDAHRTSCKLNELVDSAITLAKQDYDLKKTYDFKQIDIRTNYAEDLPHVICVRTEIEQVLLNLLGNAAQAMSGVENPENPARITINVKQEKDFITTEVSDNGPGIDEETRKRVFEPFFTTKPEGVGTGLGLSVSYFIITQNHGGTFTVESTAGKGAKFTFKLPINI
ncbi:cache domain-containing protein [Maridesulfovibrio frigidus]|uniref:cache domain-containing protein n=1 Tax=Maridesulfovibrio frigidus TaxID=340956 RepID=UPI0004E10408|nr:cache domain-containing protein [Maridesulfovibrio frigidus]